MPDMTGEQAGAGLLIVAGLVALGIVSGLAARLIPAIVAVPAGAAAILLLAARGIAQSRAAAARAVEVRSIRAVFAAGGNLLGTLDETRVLRHAAEAGARLSAHAGAGLLYLPEEGGRFALRAAWGWAGPIGDQGRLLGSAPPVPRAATRGKPAWFR